MPLKIYCANCGLCLNVSRKAIKSLNRIIDIVQPHECSDIPHELDLTPNPTPHYVDQPKGKFVQKLDKLDPRPKGLVMASTEDLRDRRITEHIKQSSSAPLSLIDQFKSLSNSIPEHDDKEPENG